MADDITSPPEYIEEQVTDLHIMLPSGPCQWTLYEQDAYEITPTEIRITWHTVTGVQYIFVTRSRVDFFWTQERVQKRKVQPKKVDPRTIVAAAPAAE